MPPHPPLVVILVETRMPGNLGMVARAMANFGVAELRLVNACDPLAPEARKFAVDAVGLLETARTYPDLAAALADCRWAVAATRRQGKRRGTALDLREVPRLLSDLAGPDRLALVFGREDAGLSSAEVALCSHTAAIATAGPLGSLNLAQAVLVFLYELSRGQVVRPAAVAEAPTQAELEPLFVQVGQVLERIAFLNPHRPEHVLTPLRRVLARGILDHRDLALLRGVWGRLADSINAWPGRRRGDEKSGKTG
jgi:tRNA/rRNA methyltransferase